MKSIYAARGEADTALPNGTHPTIKEEKLYEALT